MERIQTAKLVNISKANKNSLDYKVRYAIYEELKAGRPISTLQIAKKSGVTRQKIYHNPELTALIAYYKNYQQQRFSFNKNAPEEVQEREKKEFRALMSIPPIQHLESEVERLIEENHKLNVELFEIENELFAIKNGIEVEN